MHNEWPQSAAQRERDHIAARSVRGREGWHKLYSRSTAGGFSLATQPRLDEAYFFRRKSNVEVAGDPKPSTMRFATAAMLSGENLVYFNKTVG
jgi:hypothetical protein